MNDKKTTYHKIQIASQLIQNMAFGIDEMKQNLQPITQLDKTILSMVDKQENELRVALTALTKICERLGNFVDSQDAVDDRTANVDSEMFNFINTP